MPKIIIENETFDLPQNNVNVFNNIPKNEYGDALKAVRSYMRSIEHMPGETIEDVFNILVERERQANIDGLIQQGDKEIDDKYATALGNLEDKIKAETVAYYEEKARTRQAKNLKALSDDFANEWKMTPEEARQNALEALLGEDYAENYNDALQNEFLSKVAQGAKDFDEKEINGDPNFLKNVAKYRKQVKAVLDYDFSQEKLESKESIDRYVNNSVRVDADNYYKNHLENENEYVRITDEIKAAKEAVRHNAEKNVGRGRGVETPLKNARETYLQQKQAEQRSFEEVLTKRSELLARYQNTPTSSRIARWTPFVSRELSEAGRLQNEIDKIDNALKNAGYSKEDVDKATKALQERDKKIGEKDNLARSENVVNSVNNQYYDRAMRILSRNDSGLAVTFDVEDKLSEIDGRFDALHEKVSESERHKAVLDMLGNEIEAKMQAAAAAEEAVKEKLEKLIQEKSEYVDKHSGDSVGKLDTSIYDKQINRLKEQPESLKEEGNQLKKLKDDYKEIYGENKLSREGEFISVFKQRENITSLIHLYDLAKKANPSRTEEMQGYEQALKDRGINLDYAYQIATKEVNELSSQTNKELDEKIEKLKQIDDTFLTKGKEELGVSVIKGKEVSNIDRVISVYMQSGLSWKEFVGNVIYSDKDLSAFQEDAEEVSALSQEIVDLKNEIKEIKLDITSGNTDDKYDKRLEELNDAWKNITDSIDPYKINKDENNPKLTDLFGDVQYDLFEKLSAEGEEKVVASTLLESEAFKNAPQEQKDIVLKTVQLFEEQQREIENKTVGLSKQLAKKEAELDRRTAKVDAVKEKMTDVQTAFLSEKKFSAGEVKNLYRPLKEFLKKNYNVEVQDNKMVMNNDLVNGTFKGMVEKSRLLNDLTIEFTNYRVEAYNKLSSFSQNVASLNASFTVGGKINQEIAEAEKSYEKLGLTKDEFDVYKSKKLSETEKILRIDVLNGKAREVLNGYASDEKSFSEKKLRVATVLNRKNELQEKLDGRNYFAKLFSSMLPDSWTEIGKMRSEISSINASVKAIVSEQDIKDMYLDPLDEPRDVAKAQTLKPVFDYVKNIMNNIQAKGAIYESIDKNMKLMESGVFAKGNKNVLDSFNENLTMFLSDGEYDKALDKKAMRSLNGQVMNALDAIKLYKDRGVVEIEVSAEDLPVFENNEMLYEGLKDATIKKNENVVEKIEQKEKQTVVDIDKKA